MVNTHTCINKHIKTHTHTYVHTHIQTHIPTHTFIHSPINVFGDTRGVMVILVGNESGN